MRSNPAAQQQPVGPRSGRQQVPKARASARPRASPAALRPRLARPPSSRARRLTSPIARCKTYTNCEAQPITTVQYCYTDAGCITGLTFGFAPTSKPPHTVACAKDCARSKNVTVAPGDVLTGYAISFQGSGAAKCANKVTFSSKKGRSYVADASAAPGAPSAAAAAASDNASPQTYVWRKSGSAPPAPVCLTHAQRPSTPFGTLCSVKKVKCSSGGALQGVHPVWGFQQQCGLTQQQAQWSVNAPPCPAGSSAPLAGAASTGVPNGTVSYTDPASGAAVTDVTCPMPGHVVTVAPVLADGNCTYPGDPITIQGEWWLSTGGGMCRPQAGPRPQAGALDCSCTAPGARQLGRAAVPRGAAPVSRRALA